MNRRDFIKKTSGGCAFLALGLVSATSFQSCSTAKVIKTEIVNNTIRINVSELTSNNFIKIRTQNLPFDILLKKNKDAYESIYMQCTHYDNPVYFNGNKFICPSHGSEFNNTGDLLIGPATQNLKKFKTTTSNNTITISIS